MISLSVIGAIAVVTAGALGVPKNIFNLVANAPTSVENIAELVQAKPVSIFAPPKYSIDEAASVWVVVNKQRPVSPVQYKPENLAFPDFSKPKTQNPFGLKLREEAALATQQLALAMRKAKAGTLILNSGFRTYKTQKSMYDRTKQTRGLKVAENLTARPGHSEHQLGLAADFSVKGQGCAIMACFGDTVGGKWLANNAHEYGFVLRYPKGSEAITGFQYEPWHFRYVGVELAREMKDKGIKTLEEFWELDSAPGYLAPAN
jgi:D-alanyl-D-alanine carboxypeptidase